MKLKDFGCGDNSCIFGPPGGMGTNGGCRCEVMRAQFVNTDVGIAVRARFRALIAYVKRLEKELENA